MSTVMKGRKSAASGTVPRRAHLGEASAGARVPESSTSECD